MQLAVLLVGTLGHGAVALREEVLGRGGYVVVGRVLRVPLQGLRGRGLHRGRRLRLLARFVIGLALLVGVLGADLLDGLPVGVELGQQNLLDGGVDGLDRLGVELRDLHSSTALPACRPSK